MKTAAASNDTEEEDIDVVEDGTPPKQHKNKLENASETDILRKLRKLEVLAASDKETIEI